MPAVIRTCWIAATVGPRAPLATELHTADVDGAGAALAPAVAAAALAPWYRPIACAVAASTTPVAGRPRWLW